MRDALSRLLRSAALFAVPSIGLQQRGLLAALQASEERAGFEEGRRAIAEQATEDAQQALANLQRSYGLLHAAHGATVRALSIAMDGDRFAIALAVEHAKAALAKQDPMMHLDIAAVVARMGVPPADVLLTEGNPLYVGAAGCERCGNDPGSRHGTCADVAADDDEPAVGDEPPLVSQ